jgi:hypothetical protein
MGDCRLKNLLIDTLNNTTCHGASSLVRARNIYFRIIWLLAILFSISGCFYLLTQTFIDYFQFDVVTKIRVIPENEPTFPMITFCEQEILSTEYAWNYTRQLLNKTDDELSVIQSNELASVIIQIVNDNENLKLFGFNLDQILIICNFNLVKCDVENEFIWFFHPSLGMCFQYNSGLHQNGSIVPIKKSRTFGWYSGLNLMLQFPEKNQFGYYNIFNSKIILSFIHSNCILNFSFNLKESLCRYQVNQRYLIFVKSPFCRVILKH